MELSTAKSHNRPLAREKQVKMGLLVLLAIFLIAWQLKESAALNLVFGVGFGFVLQRSRICFAASIRDPIIAGTTSILKALVISFMIMTIGFAILQYLEFAQTGKLIGQIHPLGVHTAVGAIMFGFGMVIAGGCATGTLMRIGEGFQLQLLVLAGFLLGTLWGAHDYPWWQENFIKNAPIIHLPQVLGWMEGTLIQLLALAGFYYLAHRYGQSNSIY